MDTKITVRNGRYRSLFVATLDDGFQSEKQTRCNG